MAVELCNFYVPPRSSAGRRPAGPAAGSLRSPSSSPAPTSYATFVTKPTGILIVAGVAVISAIAAGVSVHIVDSRPVATPAAPKPGVDAEVQFATAMNQAGIGGNVPGVNGNA